MEQNKKTLIYSLIVIAVIAVVVIIIAFIKHSTSSSSTSSTNEPEKPRFTGAVIETIPAPTTTIVTERTNLRLKTPITTSSFTITFDYANDNFVVGLLKPYDNSRQKFNQWLKNNYPHIPIDQFKFDQK